MAGKFTKALRLENEACPPVWFMRQAGRYHSHYQNLRRQHSFEQLCQDPNLACEVTIGPINDFGFDAAILFSDILFPIEAMGIDLKFDPGPKFSHYLKTTDDLQLYHGGADRAQFMNFQAAALQKIRAALPADKGLIGFVGGLLTLYIFAVDGSHKGDLTASRAGITDGRFEGFMERILPILLENMVLQAQENIDCLAIMDSAAGELPYDQFQSVYMPYVRELLRQFRGRCPHMPVLYYAKNITLEHWDLLAELPIQAMGVDHSLSMPEMMDKYGTDFALQGNFAPENMTVPPEEFQKICGEYLAMIKDVPVSKRRGWICGLGHGITPQAHEENVRYFLKTFRQFFAE